MSYPCALCRAGSRCQLVERQSFGSFSEGVRSLPCSVAPVSELACFTWRSRARGLQGRLEPCLGSRTSRPPGLRHWSYSAVFFLGYPGNACHPTAFASSRENEAWLTFAWPWSTNFGKRRDAGLQLVVDRGLRQAIDAIIFRGNCQ